MSSEQSYEEEPPKAPAPPWMVYLGVAGAIVMAFGLITWLLGLGPFAYRQILYGTSQIYVLNMTDQDVEVTLDKGTGLEVKAQQAQRTPLLGGTTTVVTRDKQGKELERFDVSVDGNPVFYNVGGERCLVLAEVSSFYLPGRDKGVKIIETFPKGTRVVPLPHTRMVWPRQTLRDEVSNAESGVAWIEMVACSLLDGEEQHVLESHLYTKLTERKRIQEERRKQEEIQRKMLYEGSEAVDKAYNPGLGQPDAGVGGARQPARGGKADAGGAGIKIIPRQP
jgi:hypothetical protein